MTGYRIFSAARRQCLHQLLILSRFSEDDQVFIKKLLAETNVLTAIYRYYELQNFG